jgi:hypothetical protein
MEHLNSKIVGRSSIKIEAAKNWDEWYTVLSIIMIVGQNMVLIDTGTNDFHKELLSILRMYNMYKAPHSCCRYTQHIPIFRVASSIFSSPSPWQDSVSMPTYNSTCSCKKSIWNPLKTRRYHRWTRNTCWPWRALCTICMKGLAGEGIQSMLVVKVSIVCRGINH